MFIKFFHVLLVPFFIIVYIYIYDCMFCMPLFNFVNYVFLLLCLCILIVTFMVSYCYVYPALYMLISLCCSMYCLCVNVYCYYCYYCHRVSTQLQLTSISYIISYHIISYHIISYHIISYHIFSLSTGKCWASSSVLFSHSFQFIFTEHPIVRTIQPVITTP